MEITIISTQGPKKKSFNFHGKTWGDFKTNCLKDHYNMSQLRGTGRSSNNTYESDHAEIQSKDSVIYLTPMKTDSGNGNRQ